MPPIRTFSIPKPVKTERTHEENQERAYIAASRRSDRSLEARIESARRASEIHKRRTGRGLRVTEADVVNEEMYEEEDDDLPMQYRRLTAHLNGNSSDFNRRLAAYLTNSVAMRSALDQAMQSAYPSQYPQPWQQQSQYRPWAPDNNQLAMFPAQGQQQQQQQQQQNMMAPQMMHLSPSSYRQSPYPMPNSQGAATSVPQRSASIALPPSTQHRAPSSPADKESKPQSLLDRRLSMPAHTATSSPNTAMQPPFSLQQTHRSNSSTSLSTPDAQTINGQSSDKVSSDPPNQGTSTDQTSRHLSTNGQHSFAMQAQHGPISSHPPMSFSPLTTSLPAEAQMFFGPNFEMDKFNSSPTAISDKYLMPTYNYNPNLMGKMKKNSGMEQTLAPSALHENGFGKPSWPVSTSASIEHAASPSADISYALDPDAFSAYEPQKSVDFGDFGVDTSGQMTPNDSEWAAFINPDSWEEATS